jgi:hypothetical protein
MRIIRRRFQSKFIFLGSETESGNTWARVGFIAAIKSLLLSKSGSMSLKEL